MPKLIRLENLIYSIVFLLPTYLFKLQFFFFKTNVLEVLIMSALVWWGVAFYQKEKIKVFYLNYKKYILCGIVMLSGIFWSTILNGHVWQSLGIVKSWFLLPILFMLMAGDVLAKEKIKKIFFVYAASSFWVATIALCYLFLGQVTYDNRLQAFFNSPNYLAMYLAPGIIIIFWKMFFVKQKRMCVPVEKQKTRIIQMGMISVILLAFFFTRSYAAFCAVFWGGSVILWGNVVLQKIKKPLKIFVFLAITLFLFFVFQSHSEKFKSLIELNPRSSLSSRLMIWTVSAQMVKDNPLSGIGPANFQEKYLAYQKFYPPYLEWAVPHPQSIYLAFWLTGGFFGIGGFLGLIFFLGQDLWKNKNQNILSVLVLGIVAYILLHGFFDTTYFKNDLAIFFWLNFLALKNRKALLL